MAHGVKGTEADAQSRSPLGHRGEQSIVGGPSPHHPPEAVAEIKWRTVTGQALHLEMRRGRAHRGTPCALMPRCGIKREEQGRAQRGGLRPRKVTPVSRKCLRQSDSFCEARAPCGLGGTLHQAGRQLPPHHMHCRKAIDAVLLIPGPHSRPRAFAAKRGVERWHQGKAGFVLAYHEALARLRLFFLSATSPLLSAWRWGSPRSYRSVGREGRL